MPGNTSDKPFDVGRRRVEPAGRSHILVAGVSTTPVCGVRDHASLLAHSIRTLGHEVTTVWTNGDANRPPVRTLARDLLARIDEQQPDVVVLHYSVFAYAWRGIPFSVPLLAARMRWAGVPILLFAHEYAYPWGRGGWKGFLLAATQRLAMLPLVAACAAMVVTTDERVDWIRSRRWLPRRPITCAPVFSNIPAVPKKLDAIPGRVGIFGFGAEGLLTEPVVGAVAQVHRSNPDAHLRLIGAPGPESPAGRRLQELADRVGCPVSFSGLLGEDQLSQELSSCEVVFHTDPAGPTSRKTTLAAALSHGRPVVAFDGPDRWQELVDAGAVELVPADERAATALAALLQNGAQKAALAERARGFAAARLSAQHTARTVLETIDRLECKFTRQRPQPGGKLP